MFSPLPFPNFIFFPNTALFGFKRNEVYREQNPSRAQERTTTMMIRKHLYGKLLAGKAGQVRDSLSLHAHTSPAGISTYVANGQTPVKIFAPYSVFKGKAALSVQPCLPTFTKLSSGDIRLDRNGNMMLTFWPAIGERKYDWEKKQRFALSPTEAGALINLGPKDSCEFFHDPSMKTSNEGQVRKSLSIKPHVDGSGYFISLSVMNSIQKTNERFTVPVTSAEFAVLRTSFSFALPRIMGWDRYTNQKPAASMENQSPMRLNSEWDR